MQSRSFILSLIIASSAVVPVFAVRSLEETFANPRLELISPELKNKDFRKQVKDNLIAQIETPFLDLHKQFGDATTLACEEELAKIVLSLFRTAVKTGVIQDAEYQKLTAVYTKLHQHLTSKKADSEENIKLYIACLISRRILITSIEFNMEYAGKQLTNSQKNACDTMITTVNDLTTNFLVKVVGVPVPSEDVAA
jgi:hypothetical protein